MSELRSAQKDVVFEAAMEVVELAAKTAHEVNRAYCVGLGDHSQVPWEEAPDWQRESAIEGAKLISEYPETSPSASHQGWFEQKRKDGWKYGPVKDMEKKEHPCFVPFEDLPPAQQAKDILFGATVRGVLGLGNQQGQDLYVIFDGPPEHESGRFVEVENEQGSAVVSGAVWTERSDGLWALGPFSRKGAR